MPSEKARKLNTREIHLQDFRLYISENMVYPPSALWALDGRLHVPREWGGGGVLEITILVTRGSTYPF